MTLISHFIWFTLSFAILAAAINENSIACTRFYLLIYFVWIYSDIHLHEFVFERSILQKKSRFERSTMKCLLTELWWHTSNMDRNILSSSYYLSNFYLDLFFLSNFKMKFSVLFFIFFWYRIQQNCAIYPCQVYFSNDKWYYSW